MILPPRPSAISEFLAVALILILPIGAFVLRNHRRNARGLAAFALNTLTVLAFLTVPLLLMLALLLLISFADMLWQLAHGLRGVTIILIAFFALLTVVRWIRGPNKVLRFPR